MNSELTFLNALQSLRTPFLDALMPLISNGLVLWLLLPAAMLLSKKRAGRGLRSFLPWSWTLSSATCSLRTPSAASVPVM